MLFGSKEKKNYFLLTLALFFVIDVGNISKDKWVLISLGDSIFSTNSMEFSAKTPSTSVTADILKNEVHL